MIRKPKQYDDDDGRVICPMDADGMRKPARRIFGMQQPAQKAPQGNQLTRSEARLFTWYATLAGLLIAGVFSVTWILFILFCTQVWFK